MDISIPFPKKHQLYDIAQQFEAEPVILTSQEDNFIDVTQELFDAVDTHLGDCEMICKPNFNLDDTMSAFELNNLKMDLRWQRNKIMKENAAQFEELEKFASQDGYLN